MTIQILLEEQNDLPLAEAIQRANTTDLSVRDLYISGDDKVATILYELIGEVDVDGSTEHAFHKCASEVSINDSLSKVAGVIVARMREEVADMIRTTRCLRSQLETDMAYMY